MIIKLQTEADLFHFREALEAPTSSIAELIAKIANANAPNDPIEIQIHNSLLIERRSYIVNPAQLAAYVGISITNLMICKGMRRAPFTVIYCTNNAESLTFIGKVRDAINSAQEIEVPIHQIPDTYRYQPHLLRFRIKQDTGFKLKIKKLKTKHIYSR